MLVRRRTNASASKMNWNACVGIWHLHFARISHGHHAAVDAGLSAKLLDGARVNIFLLRVRSAARRLHARRHKDTSASNATMAITCPTRIFALLIVSWFKCKRPFVRKHASQHLVVLSWERGLGLSLDTSTRPAVTRRQRNICPKSPEVFRRTTCWASPTLLDSPLASTADRRCSRARCVIAGTASLITAMLGLFKTDMVFFSRSTNGWARTLIHTLQTTWWHGSPASRGLAGLFHQCKNKWTRFSGWRRRWPLTRPTMHH
mmetsp:Transcript_27049/g.43441  ORF Transcript_27049/g.43441 Transcript_27049/m.43441 type:complete len:261 (-) Transcript_27049:1404-2186(-)